VRLRQAAIKRRNAGQYRDLEELAVAWRDVDASIPATAPKDALNAWRVVTRETFARTKADNAISVAGLAASIGVDRKNIGRGLAWLAQHDAIEYLPGYTSQGGHRVLSYVRFAPGVDVAPYRKGDPKARRRRLYNEGGQGSGAPPVDGGQGSRASRTGVKNVPDRGSLAPRDREIRENRGAPGGASAEAAAPAGSSDGEDYWQEAGSRIGEPANEVRSDIRMRGVPEWAWSGAAEAPLLTWVAAALGALSSPPCGPYLVEDTQEMRILEQAVIGHWHETAVDDVKNVLGSLIVDRLGEWLTSTPPMSSPDVATVDDLLKVLGFSDPLFTDTWQGWLSGRYRSLLGKAKR
jgi:hypothetical protein